MRTWKQWRGAFLIFAIACAIFSMSATRSASALPVQAGPGGTCPASLPDEPGASYTLITAGPLGPSAPNGPYCGQTGGPLNPTSGGECPIGYFDSNVGNAPVCNLIGNSVPNTPANPTRAKSTLQFAITVAHMRAAGLSDSEIAESLGMTLEELTLLSNIIVGSHLGMYTDGSSSPYSGFGGVGGGFATHGNGYGVTDTAGNFAPGSTTPSFRSTGGNGGIFGTYDASHFLPSNQYLFFSGRFDYTSLNVDGGPIPGLNVASGSARLDLYTLGAFALYYNNRTYLQATGAFNFGHSNETFSVDGSTGSFNSTGYFADARLGRIFILWGTAATASASALPTKAPPKSTPGPAIGIDVSGHLGYFEQQIGSFTDSSGFVFGTDRTIYGDVGARAKLFALLPYNGLMWRPYVAVTLDQQFGFSSVLNIPNQPTLLGGDVLSLQEAQTFWGGQLGLEVSGANGWVVGAKGFYTASADTNIAGGTAYVKIPFDDLPMRATRY